MKVLVYISHPMEGYAMSNSDFVTVPVPTGLIYDFAEWLASRRPSPGPNPDKAAPPTRDASGWDELSLRDLWNDCARIPERRAVLIKLADRGPRGLTNKRSNRSRVSRCPDFSVPGHVLPGKRFGRDLPFTNTVVGDGRKSFRDAAAHLPARPEDRQRVASPTLGSETLRAGHASPTVTALAEDGRCTAGGSYLQRRRVEAAFAVCVG